MLLLTRLAVDWHDEYDVTTGIDVAGWRAAAAEAEPEEFLPWYEEQLAYTTDTDERAQLQELRDRADARSCCAPWPTTVGGFADCGCRAGRPP